jgi:hypothetical protein
LERSEHKANSVSLKEWRLIESVKNPEATMLRPTGRQEDFREREELYFKRKNWTLRRKSVLLTGN